MLAIKNLCVTYKGGANAISNLSFEIKAGESVALVGDNGSGKTTLMRALVGVLPSGTSVTGDIVMNGVKLTSKTAPIFRRDIAFVFQNPEDMLFMNSVRQDVEFGLQNMRLTPETIKSRVDAIMDSVGVLHLADKPPQNLSGGEQRMCSIAAALASNPSLIMFDEPTAYLDNKARRTLIELINGLPQAKLIASHDMAFLDEVTGKVLSLGLGR